MEDKFDEVYEEVKKLLECPNINWLFGAGISCDANIPLMYPLTELIDKLINSKNCEDRKVYNAIKNQLKKGSHIENYLSQIGDLIALIERTEGEKIKYGRVEFTSENLNHLYKTIIFYISDIIKYGYLKVDDKGNIGNINNPLVTIDNHIKFVQAIKSIEKDKVTKMNFFTTNYDTLLEDALCIEHKNIRDGFLGTAIGYWSPEEAYNIDLDKYYYNIYKLHGSIDWYYHDEKELLRCRYGTKYFNDSHNILIYPQATKYVETQKDPFAFLFTKFRESLNKPNNNILIVNGYSFGDYHINNEIENALLKANNKTTILTFIKESKENCLPKILKKWMEDKRINERIYILTNKGIYNGMKIYFKDTKVDEFRWWTFTGMIEDVLMGGFE